MGSSLFLKGLLLVYCSQRLRPMRFCSSFQLEMLAMEISEYKGCQFQRKSIFTISFSQQYGINNCSLARVTAT